MASVYDAILGRAYQEIFGSSGTYDPNSAMKAGWVGAGAGIAAWWLESDREITAQEACDLLYPGMCELIAFLWGPERVLGNARELFILGFDWLLQYEVPPPGAVIH